MTKMHVLILALSAVACATCLSAQYARTDSTTAYVERTGTGLSLTQPNGPESYDDTYFILPLPFTLRYFDRSYTQCYLSSNGRITFSAVSATNFQAINLTPAVSDPAAQNTIMVIGGDLYAYPQDAKRTIKAFTEADRVIVQWEDAAFFSGSRILFLNFQCHLLNSGNIEFHYGPEFNPVNMPETPSYSSGIVNIDGSASYAGFGNLTATQTARPASGATVTFTYSGTLTDTVVIEHGVFFPPTTYLAPAVNQPVLSFRMRAVGNGDTVDDLSFFNQDFAGLSENVSIALVEDTAPLGQYNGEATLATSSNISSFTTFAALNLALTLGQTRNFLLVVSFSSLTNIHYFTSFSLTETVAPAPIEGGMVQTQINLSSDPIAYMVFDASTELPPPAGPAEADVVLGSFTLKMVAGQASRTITDLDLAPQYTGTLTDADIVNVRLYRDEGTTGELDGDDTLLDTLASFSGMVNFTGLSEQLDQSGSCYLIVADVASAIGGAGTVRLMHSAGDGIWPAISRYRSIGDGATTTLWAGPSAAASLRSWVALPGATNVQAFSFNLRAVSGTGTVSFFQFDENSSSNLSSVMAARFYGDNGSTPGRLDPLDTQIAGVFTVGATTMTFTPTTPVNALAGGADFHVGVDFTGAASTAFRLVLGSMTHSFNSEVIHPFTGPNIRPTGNGANGVDLTYNLLSSSFTLVGQSRHVLATANVVARGTGGGMPALAFNQRTGPCGRGGATILVEVYVEGAGPLGELDSTDVLGYGIGSLTDYGPFQMSTLPAGANLNLLFVARGALDSGNFMVPGQFTMQFAGVGGNETRILPAQATVPVYQVNVNRQKSASKKGGGGGGDGGCTTSNGKGNWMGLLAAMMAMVIAVRLRRTRA
jgi:hypothetical protein